MPDIPLVEYALAGLRRCWMPERESWSHKYHLDGRSPPNESLPHSDLYYSLNVLLGLARVPASVRGRHYDVPHLLRTLCERAAETSMRNGAWGMALWAAAELGLDAPSVATAGLARLSLEAIGWTAQDIGLSLSGACAQARHDRAWRAPAQRLRDIMLAHFRGPGALFRDGGRGPRRYFATFATQVYAGLGLYHYGESFGDDEALAAADGVVRQLIALQGPLGEWPWFYLPARDQVLDPYEVYSVHQHGMAPALLHHAVDRGIPGARPAIEKGYRWIFGQNLMYRSMLVPRLQLMYRSQARQGLAARREARLGRALVAGATGSSIWPDDPSALRLTEEMRSYEYGWLLWSFGSRTDYPDFTANAAFACAASDGSAAGGTRGGQQASGPQIPVAGE